ncbi:MAG: glycosyltransferase family 2 protein [Thermoplasmata archaeon]
MRATLLIPTLNEGESIGHVLGTFRVAAEAANRGRFASDPIDWEILVVDGDSTDGTPDRARAGGARVITEGRRGYGRAYRTGFAEATGEILATLDGDATYPADRVPEFVGYLLDHDLDFLSGDRLTLLDRRAMTTEHRIGNWLLNFFVRIAYHRYLRAIPERMLRDSQSGMWVFRRRVLDRVHLTQNGMPLSEELKLEVLIRGYRFREIPIAYGERWGAPKLSSWRDGSRNLSFLLFKRMSLAREPKGGRGLAAGADGAS